MKRQASWQRWALPIFLFLAVILRLGTFFPSVINHDESTYILIGNGILHGQTYLVDSFDTKPIGVFLIYALFNFLGGGSIFVMRLLTAMVIGLTAYLICKLTHKASGHTIAGQAAGLIYILLTSIFKFYGLSPNTELFFVPFAIGAIYLAWGKDRQWWHFLIAGFLLGLGFVIKYVIAADALALGLILLWLGWKNKHFWKSILQFCLSLCIGFIVPIMTVYLYYLNLGAVDNFLFYTFEVTSRYPVEASWGQRLLFVLDFFGRFFPFALLAIAAWRKEKLVPSVWKQFLLLWLICVTVMTLLPGKTFGHYQIQMMPILAILAGHWFISIQSPVSKLEKWWSKKGRLVTNIIWIGLSLVLIQYYTTKPDYPKEIASILHEKMEEGDEVYTGNYHHIIYYLLGQKFVTPYVHSSLLFYKHHTEALEIDLLKEAKRIVDEVQPLFVLLRKDDIENELTDYIYLHYKISEELPDNVWLLEQK